MGSIASYHHQRACPTLVFSRADRKDCGGPQGSHAWNTVCSQRNEMKISEVGCSGTHSLLALEHRTYWITAVGCRCFQEKAAIHWTWCDVKGQSFCEPAQCFLLNCTGWKPKASIQYLLSQYFTSLLLLQIQRIFNHQRMQYLHQTLHSPV